MAEEAEVEDAAYDRRKEDSERGSAVSIGIIGVGRGGHGAEGVFLFCDAPERAEDALFCHGCSS